MRRLFDHERAPILRHGVRALLFLVETTAERFKKIAGLIDEGKAKDRDRGSAVAR